jgi:phosphoribosylformylglycinamidine synthase
MDTTRPATASDAADFGLKPDEWQRILTSLGRTPNLTELGIFSVMWSEHCSYKSSKKHLMGLPTTGPRVIHGPGENAGVVDIGDGDAVVFKIESHNHPSFIEPYQGAATGVGGIMRDVFTMGARPIANLNALRFGDPAHPRTKSLMAGVVAGIGGYGNSFGVPTVGGETQFHRAYNGNILVNAMCVGIARTDRIFTAAASGIGSTVMYLGAKTGRDGIHGATMASAEFTEDADAKRPTVQVGDPFTEKLLLEACLELMATGAIIAIQDMGAAGLTSSSVEMAGKGGLGIHLDLSAVPTREVGMTGYEIMLSESQERMLVILKPGREAEAQAIFAKWELDCVAIGTITDTGRIVLEHGGATVCDLPLEPLIHQAPLYDRPWVATPARAALEVGAAPEPLLASLTTLLGSPDGASKRWIWEQYDHLIGGNTIRRPGGDAAVVRLGYGPKGLGITTDCNPHYCLADPVLGGMQAVAECYRNLSAVGAEPLALTDNLNFGNPERPEIMGQIVGCLEGIGKAAAILGTPIVSGNVSLYNETSGQAILPTPVVGAVGLLPDVAVAGTLALTTPGLTLMLVGKTTGWLGASAYARTILASEDGAPPPVDPQMELRHGSFVRSLVRDQLVAAAHDLAEGGLLVALAEMCMAGGMGASIALPEGPAHAVAFGEDQGRYLIATAAPDAVIARCNGVPLVRLGLSGGDALTVAGHGSTSVAELRAAHEGWLPAFMDAG